MQFKRELAEMVIAGKKTQTRRVVKSDERQVGFMPGTRFSRCVVTGVQPEAEHPMSTARIKWQEGKVYAVQPGRGKHAIGYMKLLDIHKQEDVRHITLEDAQAEGFESEGAFLTTWMAINDRRAQAYCAPDGWHWYANRRWNSQAAGDDWESHFWGRPAHLYCAWVLRFEKVE